MATEQTKRTERRYRKRLRAEQEQRTRERITAAAVQLHGSIGPARTTVSGVARAAGVQRATVYRHFPTDADLFAACSAHYWARNPLPDPESWASISDPGERLRQALADIYGLYRRTEPMLEKTSRDAALVEAMAAPAARFVAYLDGAVDTIVAGRPERGNAKRRVRAAVAHAISFPSWQSLVRRQGLGDEDAVAVMAAMVEAAGAAKP